MPIDEKLQVASLPGAGMTAKPASRTAPEGITVGRQREISEYVHFFRRRKRMAGAYFVFPVSPELGRRP